MDEIPPGEGPEQVAVAANLPPEAPASEGGVVTPPVENRSGPHSPFQSQVMSPAATRESPEGANECARHKLTCNLICMDPICASFRCFTCPECMIEIHADCQQECTFDIERFAKVLRPFPAKLHAPYLRFTDLLARKGLEFTLSRQVEGLLAGEEEALGRVTWRDFKQPNPHLVLNLFLGLIQMFSVRLGNLGRLFEEVMTKLSGETIDEIFGTTLVAFEKAVANELTHDPHSDQHPSLDDNFDMYSSSFSKKNYSDDSQVLEVEMDSGDPNAFVRPAGVRGSTSRVFEEGSDMDEPRHRHASEMLPLKPEKDARKREGRKAGPSKGTRTKSLKPEVLSKPRSYLHAAFEPSKIVREDDLEFLETLIPSDFQTQLVFSSEKNGLSEIEFHRLCDGIGPTLVLVETEKGRAGGWTDKSWRSPDAHTYQRSTGSFLFSLTKKRRYPIRPEDKTRAVCHAKYLGPCFGDDLVISGLMEQEENSSRLGSVYSDLGLEKPFEELFGAVRFAVKRLEVFRCHSTVMPTPLVTLGKAVEGSTILSKDDVAYLCEICDEFTDARLLYRSRDTPYTPFAFHQHCDRQGPTLVVIKAQGQVGGGFTDVDWDLTGGYKASQRSFLFSLTKKAVFQQKANNHGNAVYLKSEDGPNFGDRDLYISGNLTTPTNRTNLGSYYNAAHVENPKAFIFGAEYFPIEEFEVYALDM